MYIQFGKPMVSEAKEKTMNYTESREMLEYAKQQFASLLRKKRHEGYSQQYLAKILGLDQPKISQYCSQKKISKSFTGVEGVSLSKILHLMQLLGTYVIIDTSEKEVKKMFKIAEKPEEIVSTNIEAVKTLSPKEIEEIIKEVKNIKQVKIKEVKKLKKVALREKRRDLLEYANQKLAMVFKKKKEQGLSQLDLAEILAITPARMSTLIHSKKSVSLGLIINKMEQLGYYAVIDMRETEVEKRFKVYQI